MNFWSGWDLFVFYFPFVHVEVICDTGKNLLGLQPSCILLFWCTVMIYEFILVMESYSQDLVECFPTFLRIIFIHVNKDLLFFGIFSVVFFVCINKVSVIIGTFHIIDVVIWLFKVDCVQFGYMTSKFIFGRTCINNIV